jgi:hypothetical protein
MILIKFTSNYPDLFYVNTSNCSNLLSQELMQLIDSPEYISLYIFVEIESTRYHKMQLLKLQSFSNLDYEFGSGNSVSIMVAVIICLC